MISSKPSILVTGATGMLGAYLLLELTQAGYHVRAMKRRSSSLAISQTIFDAYAQDKSLYTDIDWVEGDVLDIDCLHQSLKGIDHVYHLAAKVSFAEGDKQNLLTTNIDGTANIVNAALETGIDKFCYVSSIAALGDSKNGKAITEAFQWQANAFHSVYAISKFRAEMEVWRAMAEGLKVVIVNPSVILGAGDWQQGSPSFFATIWQGLKYYTNGTTGYVDARDVANIMRQLMESETDNERFILNAGNYSYQEVFNCIAEALGKTPPKHYVSPTMLSIAWRADRLWSRLIKRAPKLTREMSKSAHNKAYYDNQKIKDELKIEFTPIEETIKEIAGIFLKQQTD